MRVALVCPYDLGRFGGVQDQVFKLADWLAEEGHRAWVVGPGVGPEGAISVGRPVVIEANGSATPIALSPRVVRRVRAAVAGADVVHVHEPLMPMVSLAATFGVRTPSVGTFHADAARGIRWVYRRMFSATAGRVGRIDEVTAVSPVAAAPLSAVNHTIVPNGLDTSLFAEAAHATGAARHPGRVVFLGRDDPRKGLDVFEAAASLIAAADPGASFVVAGTDLVGERGAVRHVGRVSDHQKRELLCSADVFVAPHRGGESFGIVVAEAMAAGCAVVASALPAFAHVLGDTGVLVAPGDVPAFANAVGALLRNHERRSALGSAALRRVLRFDRSVAVAGYLEVYERAIRGH